MLDLLRYTYIQCTYSFQCRPIYRAHHFSHFTVRNQDSTCRVPSRRHDLIPTAGRLTAACNPLNSQCMAASTWCFCVFSVCVCQCLEGLVFEMTYYVSSGTFNSNNTTSLLLVRCDKYRTRVPTGPEKSLHGMSSLLFRKVNVICVPGWHYIYSVSFCYQIRGLRPETVLLFGRSQLFKSCKKSWLFIQTFEWEPRILHFTLIVLLCPGACVLWDIEYMSFALILHLLCSVTEYQKPYYVV